jgi:hypothetical protein
MVATHQSRQANQLGKENMNLQPKRVTLSDEPITKKQFQDMMADFGQVRASTVRMEIFLKEHITTHQRGNQNTKKKPQYQASQNHVAGLAATQNGKKRFSSKQKAQELKKTFPTKYDSDSSSAEEQQQEQHFAKLAFAIQPMLEFNRIAYGLKLSPNQIGIKRTKLNSADQGIFPLSPAVASSEGNMQGNMHSINYGYDVVGSVIISPASDVSSCSSLVDHAECIIIGEPPITGKIANFQRSSYVERTHDSNGNPIPALESCTDEYDQPPPLMDSGDIDGNDGNQPPPPP